MQEPPEPPKYWSEPDPNADPKYWSDATPTPLPAKPRNGKRGFWGGAVAFLVLILTKLKYLLIIFKLGAVSTMFTLLISFGFYALVFGPWFAGALVIMILVHEMGHVLEIRRQGMKATAPLFIPFVGAAIFQRSRPIDAFHQALIGIAGPILGTLGAVVAFVLYNSTGWTPLLLAAWLGFYINLFNLIPVGMLDGGWVLGAVSKWFQVFGLAFLAFATIFLNFFSPLLLLFVLFAIPMIWDRFRHPHNPYYDAVTLPQRLGLFVAWMSLALFLGYASLASHAILAHLYGQVI